MEKHVARLQDTLEYEKAKVSCTALKNVFTLLNQEMSIRVIFLDITSLSNFSNT